MKKEIIIDDIHKVKQLLSVVFKTENYIDIARMGGLTNHTYKVTLENNDEYVVRIPGEGTEKLINRRDEEISTKLACAIGIDAELLYFGKDGSKVTKCIPGAVTMSEKLIQEEKRIGQIAEVLKKLHESGVDTGVSFNVFEMATGYEKIIFDNNVLMFDDYYDQKTEVMRIKAELDASIPTKKVPCHNDPLCENWVEGKGVMYLIDWEYAGMNDGMWDLADVSIEASFDSHHDIKLLTAYLGREPDINDRKKFLAHKIYVDYLWTLWAKARVPYDGLFMEEWAFERYGRLKKFICEYQKI